MAYTEINLLHSQKYYQVFGHLWLVKLKKNGMTWEISEQLRYSQSFKK